MYTNKYTIMKNQFKTLIFTVLIFAFCGNNLNAQFLNKLRKNLEEKVEQKVIEKTSDKAAEKTEKTLDKTLEKILEPQFGGDKKSKKITPQNVPASFEFEYQYQLKMTTIQSKTNLNMDYYLKPGATYMGIKMNQGQEIFMIMDGETNINYMFMNMGANKIATATSIDGDDLIEQESVDYEGYTISDLPNKTFLDYDCKGKKMESDEYVFIMYFAEDGPISFNDVFKTDTDRVPKAIKDHFKEGERVTMMYMEMKDKVNKGKKNTSGTIECTLLEPTSFMFDTAGYKFM